MVLNAATTHSLYVTVDADNQISETDEGNNTTFVSCHGFKPLV